MPGRKTDIGDAQWLATLARAGLWRGSFVPPAKLRQLRLLSRQRQKLSGMLSAEKNRLHKVLADGGIRLNVVVSDIHGKTRCGLQAKYQALVARRGTKRAIVALAHKMLRIIYFMISRRDYYRDTDIDYEALIVERNASRWIWMLTCYGYLPQSA